MAKRERAPETQAKPIEAVELPLAHRTTENGADAYLLSPWPPRAKISIFQVETFSGIKFAAAAGVLTIALANGIAEYRKSEDQGDDATVIIFDLEDGSSFEPMPEVEGSANGTSAEPAEVDESVPEVLDTAAEDASARYSAPPMRLSERVSAAVRAATKASDHSRHAALHQLESAIGEFRRRCQDAVPLFDDGSIEHDILTSIATEL